MSRRGQKYVLVSTLKGQKNGESRNAATNFNLMYVPREHENGARKKEQRRNEELKVHQRYCCKKERERERERERENAGVVVSDKFTREAVLVVNFLYL